MHFWYTNSFYIFNGKTCEKLSTQCFHSLSHIYKQAKGVCLLFIPYYSFSSLKFIIFGLQTHYMDIHYIWKLKELKKQEFIHINCKDLQNSSSMKITKSVVISNKRKLDSGSTQGKFSVYICLVLLCSINNRALVVLCSINFIIFCVNS